MRINVIVGYFTENGMHAFHSWARTLANSFPGTFTPWPFRYT